MAAEESVEGGALRTPWRREFATPVRAFLKTESGSAGILVAAIAAGLLWANLGDSYERLWTTSFGFVLGDHGVTRDLRTWVNSGLMTFFFLVVGLEARREIDLGDLRDRQPVPAAGGSRAVRDGRPGRALSHPERRWRRTRRLGRRDVDRHSAGARAPGDGRARGAGPGPDVPAHRLRRRRPRGAAGDRGDVHRAPAPGLPGARGGALRRVPGGEAAPPGQLHRVRRGGGDLVQRARERDRPGGDRPRHRSHRRGVHTGSRRPRGGERAVPAVPRGADAGPRTHSGGRPDAHAVAQRPAAALLPPVDQLCDRAALRARERGGRHRRVVPAARGDLADHPRHRARVRRRKARRGRVGVVGDRPPDARPGAAGGRLGVGRGKRDDRRDRLHGLVPDRRAGVRR